MIKFVFKLVYSDERYAYNVPSNWTLKYMFLRIRDYIVNDFSVNNAFEFVCVDEIPLTYMGAYEEYASITNNMLNDNDTVGNYFNSPVNTFYIRPLEDTDYETNNGNIILID